MFHSAAPASHKPALRPTRGSGFGAMDERSQLSAAQRSAPAVFALFAALDGATLPVDAFGCAHAAAMSAAIATEIARAALPAVGRRIQRLAGYRDVMVASF